MEEPPAPEPTPADPNPLSEAPIHRSGVGPTPETPQPDPTVETAPTARVENPDALTAAEMIKNRGYGEKLELWAQQLIQDKLLTLTEIQTMFSRSYNPKGFENLFKIQVGENLAKELMQPSGLSKDAITRASNYLLKEFTPNTPGTATAINPEHLNQMLPLISQADIRYKRHEALAFALDIELNGGLEQYIANPNTPEPHRHLAQSILDRHKSSSS